MYFPVVEDETTLMTILNVGTWSIHEKVNGGFEDFSYGLITEKQKESEKNEWERERKNEWERRDSLKKN